MKSNIISPALSIHTGSLLINYRKTRPLDLDGLAKMYEPTETDIANKYNPFTVSEIQSFNPLYNDFFVLNETNYNRVQLDHQYYLEGASIKTELSGNVITVNVPYYVKCSPILDPIHYLVGKYHNVKNLNTLPKIHNKTICFAKIANKQNASYVDGFFSYLSSKLKHKHNMINAIDFYGSYLAVQKVFKAAITDDIDYLHQSNYFMDHIGKGVSISCGTEYGNAFDDFTGIGSRANKKRLVLEDELDCADLCIDVLDTDEHVGNNDESANISCEYVQSERSSSSYFSESDTDSEDEFVDSSNKYSESDSETSSKSGTKSELDSGSEFESEMETVTDDSEEEFAYAYIDDFPANLIFLEKCDGTLDRLLMDHEVTEESAASCLMQIVMSLIAFQNAFHFTHNDLHTNNVMYVNTDIEFLYYKYNDRFYRVPTYGKIFKIIDFGRSIYQLKDQIYCSDSFAPKGDAHSQYNTEPYFNNKRPRVEPNLSFDLCRLGTSIYDFIIQDENEPRDEFQETIYRWCLDDNGKNVMYRRDGEEKYPGFKLYKMIARNVHGHTPQEQLKYPFFSQFLMDAGEAAKLDLTEVRKHGLNLDLVEREYV
jgi:hypothetical protein